MSSVLILQFAAHVPPGHFAASLTRLGVPWRIARIDAGETLPETLNGISGIGLMGGPMSANDDLPWIAPVLALVRRAIAAGVPVIGHCLGGQLMSRALGGRVTKNPVKEIGWGAVRTTGPAARDWLGDLAGFEAFHWHGETFDIPAGATRILESACCPNQAFALGPHLGMQCHVEMTAAMIRLWCRQWADECAQPSPSVLTPEQMQERMEERIAAMRVAADRLYTRWIGGLDKA